MSFIKALGKLAKDAAEKYRDYWERENQKLREQVQAAQYSNLLEATQDDYFRLGELLMEAINNTAEFTHLCPVSGIKQIFHNPRIVGVNDGLGGFRFRCRRYRDNKVTAEDVTRILQREMNQLCADAGWPQVVLKVRFGPDGIVLIDVVYVADAHRYRQRHPRG